MGGVAGNAAVATAKAKVAADGEMEQPSRDRGSGRHKKRNKRLH